MKLNPLAEWTHDEVWDYLRENDVPTHALYERGYTSIGCAPCTRAIGPGEPTRAGRWWWETDAPKECGMHCSIETGGFEHELHAILGDGGGTRDRGAPEGRGGRRSRAPRSRPSARRSAGATTRICSTSSSTRSTTGAALEGRHADELDRLLTLALQSGRVRALYGPGGEQAALRAFRKLPTRLAARRERERRQRGARRARRPCDRAALADGGRPRAPSRSPSRPRRPAAVDAARPAGARIASVELSTACRAGEALLHGLPRPRGPGRARRRRRLGRAREDRGAARRRRARDRRRTRRLRAGRGARALAAAWR